MSKSQGQPWWEDKGYQAGEVWTLQASVTLHRRA